MIERKQTNKKGRNNWPCKLHKLRQQFCPTLQGGRVGGHTGRWKLLKGREDKKKIFGVTISKETSACISQSAREWRRLVPSLRACGSFRVVFPVITQLSYLLSLSNIPIIFHTILMMAMTKFDALLKIIFKNCWEI